MDKLPETNASTAVEERLLPGQMPVLKPGHTLETVTDKIVSIVLRRPVTLGWLGGFAIFFGLLNLLLFAAAYLFYRGVGIWGINIPVGWGFAIVNFVWWIGIGHAGTLISAILLLLKQGWRNSINRFAEAMTLFAVACAGLFPILHTGRPWLAYWLFPYPNTMGVWPQFRSPLLWDVFAVSTYATISALFWFIGLIPDLATFRDSATNPVAKTIYGLLAMGWRGSARHWKRYESAYLLLAGLATPLVLSVHTVVSFDFAISIVPGWHTTIFPPYFVAGAIYSGFAMVLVLAIPIRKFYGVEDMITLRHLDNSAKIMLGTGLIVAYGYMMEAFYAYYSGNIFEWLCDQESRTGPDGVGVLVPDPVQCFDSANALDSQGANDSGAAVRYVADCAVWHVAGALRNHRHQPFTRLPSVLVGQLCGHALGLCGVRRNPGTVLLRHVPVCAADADDHYF